MRALCVLILSLFGLQEVAKQIHQLYLTQYPQSSCPEGGEVTGIEQAMNAAAEELRRWPDLEESARATWVAQEERSVVFQVLAPYSFLFSILFRNFYQSTFMYFSE